MANSEQLTQSPYQLFNHFFDLMTLNYHDLLDFLIIDPQVERIENKMRIKEIQHYIENAIMNNKIAIITPILASNRKMDGKHVILDGQHRFLALANFLKNDDETSENSPKKPDNSTKYTTKQHILKQLEKYMYPVMIVDSGNSIEIERQFFSDINFNAQKVSRSLAILFNSRDFVPNLLSQILLKNEKLNAIVNKGDFPQKGQIIKIATLYDAINQLIFAKSKPNRLSQPFQIKSDESIEFVVELFLNFLLENVISTEKRDFLNNSAVIQAFARFAHDLVEQYENWLEILTETTEIAIDRLNSSQPKYGVLRKYDFNVTNDGKVSGKGTGFVVAQFKSFLNNCKQN